MVREWRFAPGSDSVVFIASLIFGVCLLNLVQFKASLLERIVLSVFYILGIFAISWLVGVGYVMQRYQIAM